MSCKNCQAKTDKEFCDICQKCIDIDKINFYKYLEYKIIHCFSRRCYICNNLYLNTDQINILI